MQTMEHHACCNSIGLYAVPSVACPEPSHKNGRSAILSVISQQIVKCILKLYVVYLYER